LLSLRHQAPAPLLLAVIGSDTGVGKTLVTGLLAQALRAAGRRVWLHKPVACGGWRAGMAEDARALAAWRGDGQPAATLCPRQFREAASPHLAAAAAGEAVHLADLLAALDAVRPGARRQHDLLIEGVGGLLVPLTPRRETLCDLLAAARVPALVVTRPHLGTLNHTALTVAHARRRGLVLAGLVVNEHAPAGDSLAVRCAARELAAVTGLPVLAQLPHGDRPAQELQAAALAASLLAWHGEPRPDLVR
jgi:dethiobiotin synthetase